MADQPTNQLIYGQGVHGEVTLLKVLSTLPRPKICPTRGLYRTIPPLTPSIKSFRSDLRAQLSSQADLVLLMFCIPRPKVRPFPSYVMYRKGSYVHPPPLPTTSVIFTYIFDCHPPTLKHICCLPASNIKNR